MTETTLSKAARAVAAADGHFPWDRLSDVAKADYTATARAVLMAVREPSERIAAVGHGHKTYIDAASFTAIIDAILEEA